MFLLLKEELLPIPLFPNKEALLMNGSALEELPFFKEPLVLLDLLSFFAGW